MVDADDIVELITSLDAADPPVIAALLHVFPVIERIAPELSRRRERIRRAASHTDRDVLLVELEHLRMGPRVRAVRSDIERDVADDLNALLIGIGLQLRPLLHELELLEAVEIHGLRDHLPEYIHGFLVPVAVRSIPLAPGLPFMLFLKCHKDAVILEPVRILRDKCLELLVLLFLLCEAVIGHLQRFEAALIECAVIAVLRIRAPVKLLALLCSQQSLFDQIL